MCDSINPDIRHGLVVDSALAQSQDPPPILASQHGRKQGLLPLNLPFGAGELDRWTNLDQVTPINIEKGPLVTLVTNTLSHIVVKLIQLQNANL